MKKKLLIHLQHDLDFQPYFSILDEVVESIDLEDYFLDKKYLDISYVVIEGKIINLDEIYFLCKSFSAEQN